MLLLRLGLLVDLQVVRFRYCLYEKDRAHQCTVFFCVMKLCVRTEPRRLPEANLAACCFGFQSRSQGFACRSSWS